jgi:AmmeMemoRadiSam system protein B
MPHYDDHIRPAAVAGLFYTTNAHGLRHAITTLLENTAPVRPSQHAPRALIVPHAGYIYSGPAAAEAYALLGLWREHIHRVFLLGPPHHVAVDGLALASHKAFATPLGQIQVDTRLVSDLLDQPAVNLNNRAHAPEHALEVQLPFLTTVLDDFSIVPALVGEMGPEAIAALLEAAWDDPHTLIMVSTDLSHFLDYERARERDRATDAAILALEHEMIGPEHACGCHALNGLLLLARRREATIERLAWSNSGDTAGDRARVVGYAAYALY